MIFRHAGTTVTAHASTTDPSRPSDAPAPHRRPVNGRDRSRRPHLLPLVFGLLDARVGGVDYLDTIGGEELMRLLRWQGAVHNGRMHRSDAYWLKTAARMRQDRQEWSW